MLDLHLGFADLKLFWYAGVRCRGYLLDLIGAVTVPYQSFGPLVLCFYKIIYVGSGFGSVELIYDTDYIDWKHHFYQLHNMVYGGNERVYGRK